MVRHLGSLHHGHRIIAINLDSNRSLLVGCFHFGDSLGSITDQAVRRYEFSIYHIRAELFTHDSEGRVGNIFHRSQKHRFVTKIYISYPH